MSWKINMRLTKQVVAVSGGFDPIHVGHVRMFQEAKNLAVSCLLFLIMTTGCARKRICVHATGAAQRNY